MPWLSKGKAHKPEARGHGTKKTEITQQRLKKMGELDPYLNSSPQISAFLSMQQRRPMSSPSTGFHLKRCNWSHSSPVSIVRTIKRKTKGSSEVEYVQLAHIVWSKKRGFAQAQVVKLSIPSVATISFW
jgi:hypothetical protein